MEILSYLFKVNLAIAVFYLVYRIGYRSDTFFTLRRYLLLSVLLISGIYPLLDISHWFRQNEVLNDIAVVYVQYLPDFTITAPVDVAAKPFPYEYIPLGIYAVMAGFFLIRLIFRLSKIIGFRIRCKPVEVNSLKAYRIKNQESPFSFFNWIFINPDNYKPSEINEILTHELVHVRQYHSIDILLSELMCIVCWFNPLAWMLKYEVHRNLEFLVDNQVIRSGIDSQSYQLNLLRIANNPSPILIANQFKKSPLKERIIMLNSKQTSKMKLVTYTLLLPLAFLILVAINAGSCINNNSGSEELKSDMSDDRTVYTVVDEQPTFPGGDAERTRFINETIRYPVVAQENGIQGRVVCSFTVEPNGEITNVHITNSVDPSLDRETIRIIGSMPRWNPGKLRGVAVPVLYTLPVQFRLTDGSESSSTNTYKKLDKELALPRLESESSSTNTYKTNKFVIPDGRTVYTVVDEPPTFPGGDAERTRFLNENIKYPVVAQECGIQGRVTCSFIVEPNGEITTIQITEGVDPSLDRETMRVISVMPHWNPGKRQGVAVPVLFTLPVTFRLQQ